MKINKKSKNTIIIFIIISFSAIMLHLLYTYHYYSNINLKSISEHTVNTLNYFGNNLLNIVNTIISSESVLKTLIISVTFLFVMRDVNISNFFDNITGVEFNSIKLSREKAEQEIEKIDEKINSLESSNDKNKVSSEKERKEIIELLIDNDNIIKIIELCLRKSKNIKIPLNLIPGTYKLTTIGKLFEYKQSSNLIKIIGIKKDIEPILIDVYNELKKDNIIYCEV